MAECTCFWVDEKYWFSHYGATEPGSQMEWNPDCLEHPPYDPLTSAFLLGMRSDCRCTRGANHEPQCPVTPIYGQLIRETVNPWTVMTLPLGERTFKVLWRRAGDPASRNYTLHRDAIDALGRLGLHCGRGPCCLGDGHKGPCAR